MTDQHPLTDEIIHAKYLGYMDDYGNWHYAEDALRAVADWQLEQVIEWLKETIFERSMCQDGIDSLPEELEKAMRPQQQQEES